MSDLVVTERQATTRDGLAQLQRRWQPSPNGPPARAAVLVVHGIGEHSGRYDRTARFLADRAYDVLAVDNRGHGRSGGQRGHIERFQQFLDDVEDLLAERRQLGLPVILLGHSLGGLIATTYVVDGRPTPDLLVLSSPALGTAAPRWQRFLAAVLSRLRPSLFVKSGIDGGLLSRDPVVQDAYMSDPLRVAGSTARLGQQIFTTMKQTSRRLDRLAVPTYALHGADDELIPAASSRPLARLPNVTYRLWPGLRHECLNEPERAEVLTELEAWLSARLGELSRAADR